MDQPVLDPAVISGLRQLTPPGEPDVLAEVLTLFLHEVPQRIARLRIAWSSSDIEEMHRVAHSLKGSTGNIGARRLYDVCSRLDALGKAGDVATAATLIDAIGVEYEKVESEIKRLMATD